MKKDYITVSLVIIPVAVDVITESEKWFEGGQPISINELLYVESAYET